MRKTATVAFLVLAALAADSSADDVTTKAGSVFAGKILSEDETSVTIDTPALGRLRISRADIAKIRRDGPASETKKEAAKTPDAKGADAKTASAPADKKPAAAKPAAPTKAPDGEDALSAEERDERRRTSKIVRHTAPSAAKPAAEAPAAATPDKSSLGGAQLAQVERGSWVIVFQPPRQFDAAPATIQIGRRIYARVESVGAASAWLVTPMTNGDVRAPVALGDVQRHFVTTPDVPRIRMLEGIDQGSWLRVRLDDGTTVQGCLKSAQNGKISLEQPTDDGKSGMIEVPDRRIVEIDGIVRSTATRFGLSEAVVGEHVALTTWPDGREVVGVLKDRDEHVITVETADGATTKFPVDGPIAAVRRVPTKWRVLASNLDPKNRVHVKSVEEFPGAHVERDVVGRVAAVTAYAVSLETPDGVLVVPFETLTAFESGEFESVPTRPMKQSERPCNLPALPGDPAAKANGVDPAGGVSIVTDGERVKHVFVSAPFKGEVFGVKLRDHVNDAQDRTDLRFDSVVVPHYADDSFAKAAEMTSNSLQGMRVTLMLDAGGCVSAIEVAAR